MAHLKPAIVNDSFACRLALVYAAFFAIVGWHLPLFPVWLQARGLDPAAIGIVLAVMQAVRVLATPAGTRLADRYGSLRGAIVTSAAASVVAPAPPCPPITQMMGARTVPSEAAVMSRPTSHPAADGRTAT